MTDMKDKKHNLKIKIEEPFKKITRFLKIIEKSSRNSKLNYFFQMINFCLALSLLLVIIPNLVDLFLSRWENITIFYLYLPKIGFSLFFYFISWVIGSIFNFSWLLFFQNNP